MNAAAWPFDEPAETPAFVCRHVLQRTAPILVGAHDGSGEQPEVVCLEDVPALDAAVDLFESFDHPEPVCFGPPPEPLAASINAVGRAVSDGTRFEDGSMSSDVIEGNRCALRTVLERAYREFLGYAMWYCDGDDFPVVQVVLPDRQGNFPWEQGASEGMMALPALWEDQECRSEKQASPRKGRGCPQPCYAAMRSR